MPLYRYTKTVPKRRRKPGVYHVVVSFVFMSIGAGILGWVIWPIVSFSVFTAPLFAAIVSPVVETKSQQRSANAASSFVVSAEGPETGTAQNVDYLNANVWFPQKPQEKKSFSAVNSYRLSIPKLGIKHAVVMIAGDDLNKSLIHYGGTALPGQYGTAVVFGHSVLPQFFRPTDYRTIFSTVPTLTIGDVVFVDYDGVKYTYKVVEMTVTQPNDLSPLEQQFDAEHLTLITCVPPGLVTARLNVRAKLVKPV